MIIKEEIKEMIKNMTPDELNWLINFALQQLTASNIRSVMYSEYDVDGRLYDPIWDMYVDEFDDDIE